VVRPVTRVAEKEPKSLKWLRRVQNCGIIPLTYVRNKDMQTERDRPDLCARKARQNRQKEMKIGKDKSDTDNPFLVIYEEGLAATRKYQRRAV
jgi:hypothetical protein